MELKELYDGALALFGVKKIEALGDALIKGCDDTDKLSAFRSLVEEDLSVDWLQMIFQYYMADRKEKKQDYTPKCLAMLLSKLIGDSDTVVDLCAGSGALAIQRWCQNPAQQFELYEVDEKVIPYLLFNLVLRNIKAVVYHGDALTGDIQNVYSIAKGEEFGKISHIKSAV